MAKNENECEKKGTADKKWRASILETTGKCIFMMFILMVLVYYISTDPRGLLGGRIVDESLGSYRNLPHRNPTKHISGSIDSRTYSKKSQHVNIIWKLSRGEEGPVSNDITASLAESHLQYGIRDSARSKKSPASNDSRHKYTRSQLIEALGNSSHGEHGLVSVDFNSILPRSNLVNANGNSSNRKPGQFPNDTTREEQNTAFGESTFNYTRSQLLKAIGNFSGEEKVPVSSNSSPRFNLNKKQLSALWYSSKGKQNLDTGDFNPSLTRSPLLNASENSTKEEQEPVSSDSNPSSTRNQMLNISGNSRRGEQGFVSGDFDPNLVGSQLLDAIGNSSRGGNSLVSEVSSSNLTGNQLLSATGNSSRRDQGSVSRDFSPKTTRNQPLNAIGNSSRSDQGSVSGDFSPKTTRNQLLNAIGNTSRREQGSVSEDSSPNLTRIQLQNANIESSRADSVNGSSFKPWIPFLQQLLKYNSLWFKFLPVNGALKKPKTVFKRSVNVEYDMNVEEEVGRNQEVKEEKKEKDGEKENEHKVRQEGKPEPDEGEEMHVKKLEDEMKGKEELEKAKKEKEEGEMEEKEWTEERMKDTEQEIVEEAKENQKQDGHEVKELTKEMKYVEEKKMEDGEIKEYEEEEKKEHETGEENEKAKEKSVERKGEVTKVIEREVMENGAGSSSPPAWESEEEVTGNGGEDRNDEGLNQTVYPTEAETEVRPCGDPPEVKEAFLSLMNMSYGHARCNPGYATLNNEDNLTVSCVDGEWHSSDSIGTVPLMCLKKIYNNSCPDNPEMTNGIVLRKNDTEAELICEDGFSISSLGTKRADLQCIDQKWQLNSSIFFECSPMKADSECDTEFGNSTIYMMNSTYGFVECNDGFTSTSGKFWMPFTCRQGKKIFDLTERGLEAACMSNEPCKEKPFPELINGYVINFSGPEGWCKEGFKFPSGDSSYLYACIGEAWVLPASQRGGCVPYCLESCQNGGTCVAPDICSCPLGFTGHTCTEISLSQDLALVSDIGNMMKGLNDNIPMMTNHEKDASTTSKDAFIDESMMPWLDDDKLLLSNYARLPVTSNRDLFGVENKMLLLNEDQRSIPNQVGMTVSNNKEMQISGEKMSRLDDGNLSFPSYEKVAENSSKVLSIVEKVMTRLPLQDDAKLMEPIYEEGTKIKNKDKSTDRNIIPWRNEGSYFIPSYKDVEETNSQDMAVENMSKFDDGKLSLPRHKDLNILKVRNTMSDFNDYPLLVPNYEMPEYDSKDQPTRNVDSRNDMAYDLSLNSGPFEYDIYTSDEGMKQDVPRLYDREMHSSIRNKEQDYFSFMDEERGGNLESQSYQASNRRIRQLDYTDLASQEQTGITNSDTTSDTEYDSQSDVTTLPAEEESPLPKEISEDYSTTEVKTSLPKKTHESDYTASNEEELLPKENPENDHPDPEEDEFSTDISAGNALEPFNESVTRISSPAAPSTPSSKIEDFSDLRDTDNLNAHSSNSSDLNDVEILENYFTNNSVRLLNYTKDSNRSISAAISRVDDPDCCEISKCGSLSVDIYNAMLRFSDTSQTATCRKGYTFDGGEASLTINCINGEWILPEPYQNMTEVTCQAVCDPPCNNSGKCIEPGVCRCPENHAGDRCQFLKCLSPPPHVKYAELEYKGLTSIARCLPGYILPGGNGTLIIECIEGEWVPVFCEEELDRRLECLPVCEEECRNGGHCVAPNTCACPKPYDGPMCQELRSNDCRMSPPEVKKAYMNYTVTLGEANCIDGYALPSGETSVKFVCNYGEWKISSPRDLRDPECQPVCVGGCQNGGVCVDANRCLCPKLYTGQLCQEAATDVCPFTPLPVPNSVTHMSPRGPYVICRAGHAFLSGETQLELWCHENNWVPAMYNDPAGVPRPIEDAHLHLACLPTCYPPCQNHGKCVDVNVCHCPKPFTGNYCQDLDKEFCWHEPPSFDNAYTVYNESKATVTCKEGYIAKTTETELFLNCDHGEWKLPPSTEEPICRPSCVPPCDNGGECTAPNTCTCQPEYYGRVCEIKRCPTVPEAAPNSFVSTDTRGGALISCFDGYIMNTGTNEVPMKCVEGQWFTIEPKPRKVESLECKPFCAQMCLNGGTCMAPNLCDCNGQYAGRYCQHLRCNDTLVTDDNADISFSPDLMTAEVTCRGNYRPSSGHVKVEFSCENGHWQAPRTMFITSRLSCVPLCYKGCTNGGKCVAPNTCQCPVGFTGSDCSKRYAHTIDGEPCIFPFIYGGVWYQACTDADSTRPWCATGVTVHNFVSSWGVCVSDVGNSKVVMTVDGELCNLPFLYNNVRYQTCISTTDRLKPWCATQVDGSGAVTKWSVCDPLWGVMTAILTTNGKMCTFPFTYNGNVYTKCVDDNLEQDVYPWCATEVTENCTPVTTETCKLDWGHTKTITTEQKRVCQFPFIWKNQTTHTCLPPAKGMGGPWCATKVDEKRNMIEWDLCIVESDASGVHPPHLEMAGSLGASGGSYTAWHSINITTITGISCIIPFVYKGKSYNGCIKQGSQPPWCATIVDERKHVMAKGICPNNWDLPRKRPKDDKVLTNLKFEGMPKEHLIHTVSGKVCILPFRYEGIQYHGCISMGSSAPYCATEVDSNGEILSKEECPQDWDDDSLHLSQDAGKPARIQTVSGESCKFPFYFNGKQYHRCITVQSNGPFCATKVDGNKQVVATDECDDANEQSHPGKYVVNYRTPIITASAEVCIFPFFYEGREYYGCAELSDRSGFICAVHVDEDNVALTFDYCPLNWDATEDALIDIPLKVTTSAGEKCIFPFRYEGITYNGCVTLGYERPFCATKTDGERNLLERGYCTLDWFKPSTPTSSHSSIRDLKTVKGQKCVIPFYFNGREYHGCVTEGTRKPFCATEVNANRVAVVTDYCDEGWQNATPLVQGYLPNVYTEDNKKCVLSYNYNGGRYLGCIQTGSSKPFCATKVDKNQDLVSHGRCSEDWERQKYRVTTETGKECIFPFTYNGVITSSCIKTAKFSRPFCATEIDEYGSPVETDFCPHDWEMMLVLPGEIKTEFGQPCVFPFRYKDQTYRSCTFDDSLKAWCATAVDADGTKTDWGYCIGLDGSTPDYHSRHGPLSGNRLGNYPAAYPAGYPGDHLMNDKHRYENAYPDDLEQAPGYSGDHNGPGDDHDRDCRHTKTTLDQECIFPFEFQGKLHNHCIAMAENGPLECAVQVNRYGVVVEWGICHPGW